MSRIEADLEAIRHLRHGLHAYAARQLDALSLAEREIAETLALLDERERYWRREQGRHPDARTRLEELLAARRRVDEAHLTHRRAAQRMETLLTDEAPRALHFLDNRIRALEAYYAVGTAQTRNANAPITVAMRTRTAQLVDVIEARASGLRQVLGEAGAQLVAQVASRKFGLVELAEDVTESVQPDDGDQRFASPGIALVLVETAEATSALRHAPADATLPTALMQELDALAAGDRADSGPSVLVLTGSDRSETVVYAKPAPGPWRFIPTETREELPDYE